MAVVVEVEMKLVKREELVGAWQRGWMRARGMRRRPCLPRGLQHGAGGAAQQGVSVSTTILYVIMGSTSGSDPNFTSVLVVVLSFY